MSAFSSGFSSGFDIAFIPTSWGDFDSDFSDDFDVYQIDLIVVAVSVFQGGAVAAEVIV